MKEKKILVWEIIGIIFIIFLGSASHFFFEFSGSWIPIGMFSPVNESVWEHLKLTYWPLILFCLIQYKFLYTESNNFLIAKFIVAILMNVIIVSIFYSYTSIVGTESLVVDIFSFILAVIIGQLISYKIMTYKDFSKKTTLISLIGLIIYGLIFIIFTFFPLELPIFLDQEAGLYGIP